MNKKLYLFLFFLFVFNKLTSQSFIYKNYSIENGLPSNEVYQVFKDSKHYLWLATDNGAVRFDGLKFRCYGTANGLPNNTILLLYEDEAGKIWFMGVKGELSFFLNDSIIAYKYNHILAEFSKGKLPVAFMVDREDQIRVSYNAGSSISIDKEGLIKKKELIKKSECQLWNGKSGYVFPSLTISNTIDSIELFTNDTLSKEENIPFDENQSFYWSGRLADGKYIFTSGSNVYLTDFKNHNSLFKFNYKILRAYEDSEHQLWLATINNGIKILNPCSGSVSDLPFFKNQTVTCFAEDYEGGFWISTHDNGVFYSKNRQIQQLNLPAKKINVTCLEKLDNTIICGTTNGEVLFLNNDTLSNELEFGAEFIADLMYDKKNNLVYAGCNSYYQAKKINDVLTGHTFYYLPFLSNIIKVNNSIYGGNVNQLFEWNTADKTLTEKLDQNNRISACAFFKGKLLVGNYNGLFKMEGKRLYPYLRENPFLNKRITSLNTYKDSLLLIGTREYGVLVYSDNLILNINESNGLNSNQIRKIRVVNDSIFICTNKGFSIINSNVRTDGFHIRNFSTINGLSSDDCQDVVAANDKLYIANNKGIDIMDSRIIPEQEQAIPIYLTSIMVNGKYFLLNEPAFHLKHSDKNIIVNFDAISFKNPVNNLFRYKLTILDTGWNITSNRTITFPFLPDGNYQLIIEPVKNPGMIKTRAELNFNVSPPFYKSGWFLMLLTFVFIIFIYSIIKFTVSRKIRKQLVEFKQRELLQEERSRIATDIHDDLGAELTRISMLLSLPINDNITEVKKRVESVTGNVQVLMDKMDDVIWLMNPTNDTINNLLAFIRQYLLDFFDHSEINPDIEIKMVNEDFIISSVLRRNIFLTVKEIVNNIVKHSNAKNVFIKVTVEKMVLNILIRDDGIGFNWDEKISAGNGLKNIQNRMIKCGAKIDILKNKEGGMSQNIMKDLA